MESHRIETRDRPTTARRFVCRQLVAGTLAVGIILPVSSHERAQALSPLQIPAASSLSAELPRELAQQLKQYEKNITEALEHLENVDQLTSAVTAAEHVLDVRRRYQGQTWWQTIDARQQLTDLRRFAEMPAEQRLALSQAWKRGIEANELARTGRHAEAVKLTLAMADVERQILGEENLNYAGSLDMLATFYRAMGRLQDVEPLLRRAAEIRKEVLGEGHPDFARSLNDLAEHYYSMGGYEQAEPLLRQASEIVKKVFGEEHPNYALNLGNRGELYRMMGRHQDAEAVLREAREAVQKSLGERHPVYAGVLNSLGQLHGSLRRYEMAEPLLRQAAEIRQASLGEQHPEYAQSLNNLAALYRSMHRIADTEALYQQILELQRKTVGVEHVWYAFPLNNLAELYSLTGRYDQARPLFERAREIFRRAWGEDHPNYLTVTQNLAEFHTLNGDYERAAVLHRQVLEALMTRGQGGTAPYVNALSTLGHAYHSMGRYTDAESVLREAVEAARKGLGPDHRASADAMNVLAMLYRSRGRYQEAEQLYRQALEIARTAYGAAHPNYGQMLNNFGVLLSSRNKYAEAEPILSEALEIKRKLGEQLPDYAVSLVGLANLYSATGNFVRAEPLYRQALKIQRTTLGDSHPQLAATLSNLGYSLAASHRPEAADILVASTEVGWRHLTRNFPAMSARQKRDFLTHRSLLASELLFTLVFRNRGAGAENAFGAALLSKQLLFEAARHENRALLEAVVAAPSAWQARWQEREQLRRKYATVVVQALSPVGEPRLSERSPLNAADAAALSERIEELEQQLRQENPAYAALAHVQQPRLKDLSLAVRPGEALVEYVSYRPLDLERHVWTAMRYGAFVLRGGTPEILAIDLGEAETIDKAVEAFRSAVRASIDVFPGVTPGRRQVRESEAAIARDSAVVRKLVWGPLEEALSGARRVYVAPDSELSLIPFEALAREDDATWRYLVEDFEVVYLATGRDLGRLALSRRLQESGGRTAVLIGNPAFDATPHQMAEVVVQLMSRGIEAAAARPAAPATTVAHEAAEGTLGSTVTAGAARHELRRDWQQHSTLDTLVARAQKQLAGLGWSVTTLTHRDAVEEAALGVQAPRLLQFATHGYILDKPTNDVTGWDNPLLWSMLLLAGANTWQRDTAIFYRVEGKVVTEAEARAAGHSEDAPKTARIELADGVLTAYEVTGMNLHGTELVNLTACETGLGEVTPDGVAGLRQAFLLAGARALTMSMWEVPAAETTAQMRDFYDRWLGGGEMRSAMTRYGAFRSAQLAALARARETYGGGHPFYWAGTVYVGDPGDLPESGR